ncbi:hypothetical protein OAA15_00475 [bacterium]|nr:hypothetical protein [bacterium]
METLSFIIGAGMVVGILTVGFAVKFYSEFQTLKERYQNHLDDYHDTRRNIWEQMERIEQNSCRSIDTVYNTYNSQLDEVYQQIDSRFDKFENKISKKQLLND